MILVRWIVSLLLIVAGLPVSAETLTGQVLGVHDGDVRREVV